MFVRKWSYLCSLFLVAVSLALPASYDHDVQTLENINLKCKKHAGHRILVEAQSNADDNNIFFRPNGEEVARTVKPINEQYPSALLFGRTCGGTIISAKWVLTAAHCSLYTDGRDVLAGTNNTENGMGLRRAVKRLVVHPRFSVGPYWLNAERFGFKQIAARWDFMLAELAEPLPLDGKTIVAARLDDNSKINPAVPVGYAGYGAERHGDTMRPDMHLMELQTLSDNECGKLVEYDKEDMLCAKGIPPRFDSACNGDSGSGLMQGNKLVGVASWVEDDAHECRHGAKVYFSRVGRIRNWIKEVTGI